MKKLINCLISVFILYQSGTLKADDPFGNEDDSYVGLQVLIPLDTGHAGLRAPENEVTFLYLNQNSGIRDGFTYTLQGNGEQQFGYIRPSNDFDITALDLSRHVIPIASVDDEGMTTIGPSNVINGADFLFYTIGGIYLIAKAIGDNIDDDPYDFEEIEDDEEIEEPAE